MTGTQKDVLLFHQSLDRASAEGTFFDDFYNSFIASGEDVASFFSNTDMERQKRKMKSSLHMMTMLIDETPGADMYMEHLARVHHRYEIPASMYQVWLDALIDTVRKNDPEFSGELEQVWRRVIGKGIEIMVSPAPRS